MPDHIDKIDIESVNWGHRGPYSQSLIAMHPGDAIAITHSKICSYGSIPNDGICSLRSSLIYVAKTKRPEVKFLFKHLADSRLAVGCFEREE